MKQAKKHEKCVQNFGQKMLQEDNNKMGYPNPHTIQRQIKTNRCKDVGGIHLAQNMA
jgi:hypothetical protein